MNEDDKVILQGRIYPALQSCVRYRYLILAGYLISFIYIRNHNDLIMIFGQKWMFFLLWAILWLSFLGHNLWNYYKNATEEYNMEKRCNFKLWGSLQMEWLFIIVFLGLSIPTSISLWNVQSSGGAAPSVASVPMSEGQKYWWNWGVSLAVALGTFLAVWAALFKDSFLLKHFPPMLEIHLLSAQGEPGKLQNGEQVVNYHLRVANKKRWIHAEDVQVYLTRVDEVNSDGQSDIVWHGNVPMSWRDQQISALTKTIGADSECDLFVVSSGGWLKLLPLITHLSLEAHAYRTANCTLILFLQARSKQANSSIVRIRVSWDGQWQGDLEVEELKD